MMGNVYKEFQSIDHALDTIRTVRPKSEFRASELLNFCGGPEWYGTDSFGEAIRLADEGQMDDGLMEALQLARSPVENAIEYGMLQDTFGPSVDPNLLYSGAPEAFATPIETRSFNIGYEAVEIVLNASVSSGVDADVIRARGRLAVSLAYVAELSGYPTKIVLGYGFTRPLVDEKNNLEFAVTLKEFSQWPDWARLSFWLIHPSSLRRIGFRFVELEGEVDPIYGTCRNVNYRGMDRSKRIVINHGWIRKSLMTIDGAIKEATELLVKEGKVIDAS